ncbi:hypothetical protein C4D60_Mb00t02190 [Musa balbisiana]|uniref:Uncharacterized protein n=1 Tax=Musa balbisiana TaxID=52838 RepID=A0A4S8I5M2_MUSBA|nr:hypothetical protein C4D60_Mb00t02190 [Musa balbisiana]
MAVEGQRDAKNAAMIPSVRTLADSKLGVDLFRGSASWNSIGIAEDIKGIRAELQTIRAQNQARPSSSKVIPEDLITKL